MEVLKHLKLLIVDDCCDSRTLLTFILEMAGAEVIAVASASRALTALERQQPDVLISDIVMPDMDGLSLMQQIRASQGDHCSVLAIALTAWAGAESLRQTQSAGFHHCLFKPVDPNHLITTIVELLPLKQSLNQFSKTFMMNAIDLLNRYLLGERNFQQMNLCGIDLKNANLRSVQCQQSNLSEAKLYGANLIDADLSEANLCGTSLYKANLSNAALKQAKLCGADLREAKLHNANLTQADLTNANLSQAELQAANLQGVILCRADLYGTRLHKADLRGANLRGADTFGVSLTAALYDQHTRFDPGFDPICQEMQRLEGNG